MRPWLTVADLCLYRQRSDLASIQQSHDFQTLDRGVQKLITTLSEGSKSFEELRTVIGRENEATREHISKAFQQQQEQYEAKEYRKRLLNSLWFDEIYSREENIVDAHRKTFEWIFDVSDHAMGPWDNFMHWLESGQGTYWINGKAGSGKSTLMSFLCQDDRTTKSLKLWSENRVKDVLMPKFYFWSSGTQMQKSIEGLLRSLIWQVLQLMPNLDITSSAFESRDMIPAWTERRLQTTFQSILQQASSSHLFCLFIDGFDEYEGNQGNLIAFILKLVKSSAVKVCLSSRPYRIFDQAFGHFARLRLHDLTHSDIRKVVVDRFQGMPQVQSIAKQRSDWLDYVTNRILARADGVFLWVTLAVNDQIRGLDNGDSLEQLEERLGSLPDQVEGIYARMLGQIEKVYRTEASVFLQMALHIYCRSPLEFVLASQGRLEDMLSSSDSLPEQDLIAKAHSVRHRIVATCAGLLEVHDRHDVESYEGSESVGEHMSLESENASLRPDDTSSWEDASSKSPDVTLRSESAALKADNASDDASSSLSSKDIRFEGEATDNEIVDLEHKVTIDFIHRTARDFMKYSAQGASFLEVNTPLDFHPQVSYVKVLLAKTRLFGNMHDNVDWILSSVRSAEDQTEVAQTGLCELIDDVMSRIDRNRGSWPTNTHWSIRWGQSPWPSMHKELLPSDSKASSPSSLIDSFHSVNSHADTSDDLRMTLVKKPDFLALAVYFDLRRYVQRAIHDRKEPLDADTVSYLLYCAVHSLNMAQGRFSRTDSLNLINEFLRQGGNPNLKDPHITIWSMFLAEMHRDFYMDENGDESRRAYMKTAVTFVEKGADLHSLFAVPSKSIDSDAMIYSLDLDLSALAVIDLCLNSQLEHSHLRDLCASKGAPYYSRCSQISIWNKGAQQWEKSIKLSDSESTAILERHKKFFAHGSSVEKLEAEMGKFLDELVQDRIEDVSESDS